MNISLYENKAGHHKPIYFNIKYYPKSHQYEND